MSTNADIDQLPFLEYARLMLAQTGSTATFDALVFSPLTELQIEAQYGEETAINVGIARDPEDPTWWKEDYARMRRSIWQGTSCRHRCCNPPRRDVEGRARGQGY